ncbi:MAG: TerB family tellurite resistance protein [Bdellovibrionales bacterium]
MNSVDAEKLMLALVSAYVWVAHCDDGVDVVEYKHFYSAILQSPFATQFDEVDLRHTFKDMVRLFEDEFESALELTRKRISSYKNQPIWAEEIIRLSRAAAVSDAVLHPVEESVLSEIEATLS